MSFVTDLNHGTVRKDGHIQVLFRTPTPLNADKIALRDIRN